MSEKLHREFSSEFLETLPYETPFFLFSRKKIEHNFREFQKYFSGAAIHYAMKANSEPEVLGALSDAGCGFEAASLYELNMLKALSVPPEKIIYGTAVKPTAHIKEFFDYGVDRFAFDSFAELEKIAAMAPGSRAYVRVRVDDTGSVFRFSEKFGAEKENAATLLQRAKTMGLHPYGVSFHVGSQASNLHAWAHALKDLRDVLANLQKGGMTVDVINLGGGYPCNKYLSSDQSFDLEDIARHTLAQYKKLPYQPQLILEPGRGMVADAGVLVASVVARVERRENTWLFLDAGAYNALFEAMAYQGSTRYLITGMRPAHDAGEMMFALAGPTGDSADIISRETLLPKDIAIGDKLIIHDIGAYNLTTSSAFNGFPKPQAYFV